LAGALVSYGVQRGDRVLIYMPMIPEAVVAMLATVRIGAVHSLVFGGNKSGGPTCVFRPRLTRYFQLLKSTTFEATCCQLVSAECEPVGAVLVRGRWAVRLL
jgi:hypothetical protein